MEKTLEQLNQESKDFNEAVMPLIKYMAENYHPHCKLIITSTNAELVEGLKSTGEILDFIKD